jgi:hypothetical protein
MPVKHAYASPYPRISHCVTTTTVWFGARVTGQVFPVRNFHPLPHADFNRRFLPVPFFMSLFSLFAPFDFKN